MLKNNLSTQTPVCARVSESTLSLQYSLYAHQQQLQQQLMQLLGLRQQSHQLFQTA
jgi:hypothetical protein